MTEELSLRTILAALLLLVPALARGDVELLYTCGNPASAGLDSWLQSNCEQWSWNKPGTGLVATGTSWSVRPVPWRDPASLAADALIVQCFSDVALAAKAICADERFVRKDSVFTSQPGPPPPPVWTGPNTLIWEAPTHETDGSPIVDPLTYIVENSTTGARIATTTALTHTEPALPAGTHCRQIRAMFSDPIDLISDPSTPPTCRTLAAPEPPPTVCTTPQPAVETRPQSCPTGTSGSWTQTRVYAAAAFPTCWTAGPWLPASAPAGACVVVPPTKQWRVAPIAAGTRPVYEPVANLSATAIVRGTAQGKIAVGKPCGAERYRLSTNSYRDVVESDVTLNSPTYRGREHTTICTLQ